MILFKHLPSIDEVSENVYTSDRLSEMANAVDEVVIYQAIDRLGQAIADMRYSSNPKIVLEMTMLSLIDFDKPIVSMTPVKKETAAILKPEVKPEVVVEAAEVVEEPKTVIVERTEITQEEPQVIEEELVVSTEPAIAESNKTENEHMNSLLSSEPQVETENSFDDNLLNFEQAAEAIVVAPVEIPVKEEEPEIEIPEIDPERIRQLIRKREELAQEIKDVRINNVLALAHKPEKEIYIQKWDSIKSYSTDPIFGKIANLIGSSTVVVASADGLLITFDHQPMVERVMEKIELVEKLIEIIYSRNVFVVAVTIREWVSIKDDYILKSRRGQKYQVKEMPDLDLIKRIDHEIKTSKVKEEAVVQKALDLDFIDEEILTIED
jgi:hypothetical protein